MSFAPTPEQQAILDAARGSRTNLIIEALAGAAKTTTLTMIAETLGGTPTLAIAFNKRIADEMARRFPSHVKSATLNSVGHRAWGEQLRKRLILAKDKTYDNFKHITDELKLQKAWSERSRLLEAQGDILKAVRFAKTWGYNPIPQGKTLVSREEFEFRIEHSAIDSDIDLGIVHDLLTKGISQAYSGMVDFDDQIYMPTLFGGSWPKFPLVMIDEAQDLSPINHAMLTRLVTQRLIAVGDPYQSIYGFRGAQSGSMDALAHDYMMERLPLSVSFRCPKAVILKARSRAPHMQWPESAVEGQVNTLSEWGADNIPDGSAIICRNNAPLMHIALELLKDGRGVKMVGNDLGPQLVKTLKKLGPETMTRDEVLAAIDGWKSERLLKGKNIESIIDKAECLTVFANFGDTLASAVAYAEHIFSSHGPIELLSGHKSKGLEWDTVFHLDPWRIPGKFASTAEEQEQESNIRYVIETRPKSVLNLVTSDGYVGKAN